jgi:hypothetical protein
MPITAAENHVTAVHQATPAGFRHGPFPVVHSGGPAAPQRLTP